MASRPSPRPRRLRHPSTSPGPHPTRAARQGAFTVTDNFDLDSFAQSGLARGPQPLRQPTDVARPGAAATAVATQNATRLVTLDDGSSTNYLSSAKDVPLPYL